MNMKCVILRYFNPVGAHESGEMGESPNGRPICLLPVVSSVAIGKMPKLTVFGNDAPTKDGTGYCALLQLGCFLYTTIIR